MFLSDGFSATDAGFGAALAALAAEATIYPFSVGSGSSCAGGTDTLADLAAASGTECFSVPDPADLPDVITNVTATTLDDLDVELDSAAVTATTSAALPAGRPGLDHVDRPGRRPRTGQPRGVRHRDRHGSGIRPDGHGDRAALRDVLRLRVRAHAAHGDQRAGIGRHPRRDGDGLGTRR